MKLPLLLGLALCSAVLLVACGRPAAPDPALAERARPADAALAAVYERSCYNCHARAGSGAPLTGDAAGWSPRLAKGRAALLASVQNGLGGMPAQGLCPDCSEAQFSALIDFISSHQETAR
ncbi:c-type cytochrome [Paucibacter sp. APW11]|uniref:C-type cytochrome n=1 Tax=Roseateles aquae TaxID=3077235 RepID=A0ABU3PEA2_9BURK|nr:c-type cytochrome [Paucibacter sp. APW11]MDT9000665.1 c-type cytochrome [Paucibacter sp. APW11]